MSVFDHPQFDGHEAVHFFEDGLTGLRAIIAVHSSALGPAAGGCRRWAYTTSKEALTDVLRLSRGMTYKNAIAGLPFGGGKSVILASDKAPKSPELFRAFGRAVQSLGGNYITAEDVGIDVSDMQAAKTVTPYVTGVSGRDGLVGGDPSPWTALGIVEGMRAAVAHRLERDSLEGLRVAVQGVGHVGYQVCRRLHDAGAELYVSDVHTRNAARAVDEFGAHPVGIADILSTDCDVLAPCALGNVLNASSIPRLKARVIAGAANNQLGTDADGTRLHERGILYTPDYVINAGGIIAVAHEYLGTGDRDAVTAEIEKIGARSKQIFETSAEKGIATNVVADELARKIVSEATTERNRLIA